MWIPREIESTLASIATRRPALILTGSRQSGKTSLLRRAFPDHRYVALDLPATAEEADLSGGEFLARNTPPVIVDEVQNAPSLLRHVKADIDAHRDDNGRFLITGSQRFPLMQGVTESLAGRAAVIELHSLSAREHESWTGETLEGEALLDWIARGGYPELHAGGIDPERFHTDYVVTYLERDVRSVLRVRSLRDFDRFLRLCALRTGQLLSFSSLASEVGVSVGTIKSWISVLEASGIVHLLEPYYENLGKRIVKTPKLNFLDTGLACFLAGVRGAADLRRSPLIGAMFESHVAGQIIRHFANRGLRAPLYFYRDHHGREVDFLLARGGRLDLVECKWSETHAGRVAGFENLRRIAGEERIASQVVVTSTRGTHSGRGGITISDSVGLEFLDAGPDSG